MPGCVKCKTRVHNLYYFSFPSDEEVKKKWIDFLGGNGFRYTKHSKLCCQHFTEDCILIVDDKRYLKDGAVPSIEIEINPRMKCPKKTNYSKRKCILCGNNSPNLTYFPLPKVEEIKQKWEKFCEFELDNKNYCLCHLHFKSSTFQIENGKRKLLPNAIPTIYFDDYQFEFIPVKTNNDDSNDAECMIVDPTVIDNSDLIARNSGADSIITIDYTEYNTPPRTPTFSNSLSPKKTAENSASDDIVNIFIPSYEDSIIDADDASKNNSTLSGAEQSTSVNSDTLLTSNGKKRRLFYPGDFKSAEITSLEVAKKSIENFRQIIVKKNKTIRVLSLKSKRLKDRNAALKETIRQLRAEKNAKETKEKDDLFNVKGWWDS